FDNTPEAPGHGMHAEMRRSLAFSQDGDWLFAPAMHDRGVRILNLANGKAYPVFSGDAPFYKAMSISVPASLVALLRPAHAQGRGPYGREMWRLTYATREQAAEKGPSASLPPSAARSTYREYASRAAFGRRLASDPFSAACSVSALATLARRSSRQTDHAVT